MEIFDVNGDLPIRLQRKNMSFLQWLIQTKFDLVANGTTIEECRKMCSKKGLYWRLPGRKVFLDSSIVDSPILIRRPI